MPIYVYKCADCGTLTEEIGSIAHRKKARVCMKCGGRAEFVVAGGGTTIMKPGPPPSTGWRKRLF